MPKRLRTPVLYVHHRSRARGCAGVPVVPDPRARRRAVRAAHLLPARACGGALPRSGRARAHRPGRRLHAHLGVDLPRAGAGCCSRASSRCSRSTCCRFRRTLRRNQFELVHFNDSPLIPAAWLARREHLPVVWHLRSALPDGGKDRALGVRARGDPEARDDVDRDHPRRRERLRRRLDGRPELRRPRRASSPGDPASAKAALGLPARPPGRLVLRLHLPVEGLPRVHRGRRAAARPRARRELPDRRRRRPRRGVLPHARRPLAPARRPDAQLRVRGEAARRRARADGALPLRALHAGHREPLPGVRRRRRAVAGARARPPGDRGRRVRRAGRRVRVAHRRRRRRPGRDRHPRRQLRRRDARRGGRRAARRAGRGASASAAPRASPRREELRPGEERAADRVDLPAASRRSASASRCSTSTTARSSAARRRRSRS